MPIGRICAGSCSPTSSGCSWGGLGISCCGESCRTDLAIFLFLTTRGAIHSVDGIVWLALARRIPLVARASTVVVALPIVVVVAAGEVTAFLLLFVSLALHHIP